jgi:hypothetical protein
LIYLSLRRVKVSSGAEREDDLMAGDEGSTSISEPARDEERLLDERKTRTLDLANELAHSSYKNKHKAKKLVENRD